LLKTLEAVTIENGSLLYTVFRKMPFLAQFKVVQESVRFKIERVEWGIIILTIVFNYWSTHLEYDLLGECS